MLRDRYDPMDIFALVPALSLAMEPVLAQLDELLDDDVLFQQVKADLRRRAPHTATRGRPSTPVEAILRMLVVKRLYHWSYAETEHCVADSLVLRQFCRVYLAPVPDDTPLLRWANLIEPTTLAALKDRVIALARSLNVTRGRQLRVDSTVVETNIHSPTASGLRGAGVRALSRLLRRAKAVVGRGAGWGPQAFRSRTCSVRRWLQQLHRLARHTGEAATAQLQHAYKRVITVVGKTQAPAVRVCTSLRPQTVPRAPRLVRHFEQFLPRVERVINQTRRRVLQGEVVAAQDKLVSLLEP